MGRGAVAGDTGVPDTQGVCLEENRLKKSRAGVLAAATEWMAVHMGSLGIGQHRCWRWETKLIPEMYLILTWKRLECALTLEVRGIGIGSSLVFFCLDIQGQRRCCWSQGGLQEGRM